MAGRPQRVQAGAAEGRSSRRPPSYSAGASARPRPAPGAVRLLTNAGAGPGSQPPRFPGRGAARCARASKMHVLQTHEGRGVARHRGERNLMTCKRTTT